MVQRGHLDTEAGFASSTVHNMRKAIEAFEAWLAEAVQLSLESVPSDNRISSLSLVHAITAAQNRFTSLSRSLTAAWQIDKTWQQMEPGECRAVLPAAAVRAALCLGSFWEWFSWVGLVLPGFLAMLHPAEMLSLTRRDLVFPRDN